MGTQTQTAHLTDEQFTDLLMGENPPTVREHLGVCAVCAQEAERFSGAIGAFQQETRLWAERRAASQPRLTADCQPAFAWWQRPQAWTAAALGIALAAGVGVSIHNSHERIVQEQAVTKLPTPVVTPETLKADNELLAAIDGELRGDSSTPASEYGLNGTLRHGRRATARSTNE